MGRRETALVDSEQSVEEVMRLWPGTIRVFLAYRMKCIGCPVGRLHTIAQVCAEYELDLRAFLEALDSAARSGASPAQDGAEPPSASRSSR